MGKMIFDPSKLDENVARHIYHLQQSLQTEQEKQVSIENIITTSNLNEMIRNQVKRFPATSTFDFRDIASED